MKLRGQIVKTNSFIFKGYSIQMWWSLLRCYTGTSSKRWDLRFASHEYME